MVPAPLPSCHVFDGRFKGNGQLHQVDGGLAPDDHVIFPDVIDNVHHTVLQRRLNS